MSHPARPAVRGVSLVELMVALAIGAVLMLGLVQIFAASRAAYQLSEGASRVQEGSRFAVDYLQRDLRMAGHFGCVNDQTHLLQGPATFTLASATAGTEAAYNALPAHQQFHISMQGYEANGTGSGAARTLPATPSIGDASQWTPALPPEVAGRAVAGSDVLALRFLAPDGVPVTGFNPGAGNAPTIGFDAERGPVLRAGLAGTPQFLGVADCSFVTVFTSPGIAEGSSSVEAVVGAGQLGFRNHFEPGNAQLFRAESIFYYVGLNPVGEPALYRLRYTGPGSSEVEELVEGVETLQFAYGISGTSANRPTGYIGEVHPAGSGGLGNAATSEAAAATWRLVGAVHMGLLVRSPNPAAVVRGEEGSEYHVLGVQLTPSAGDTRARNAYETTVALRNRLFGN
ncbi:PilW family protein [Coralloluteibacterium thermophilus]|uniref:PilW family protein n=1 Tax=Coralloluteibacterium thermophilum TaxID=2707049 RepID=A0ABV9NIT8_9GAMM